LIRQREGESTGNGVASGRGSGRASRRSGPFKHSTVTTSAEAVLVELGRSRQSTCPVPVQPEVTSTVSDWPVGVCKPLKVTANSPMSVRSTLIVWPDELNDRSAAAV
jgi:hypothetical protein